MFPSEAKSYYQNSGFLGDFELAYENLMDSVYYLGPLREHPRREYHWAGAIPEDVGQRGERTMDAMLAATVRRETRSLGYKMRRRPFQEMIAYWLHELGLIREFEIKEIARVTPSDDDRRGFEELPENAFDRSDRKFLAVAVVGKAVVLNAADSDWHEHEALMDSLKVEVTQLCPQYATKEVRRGR